MMIAWSRTAHREVADGDVRGVLVGAVDEVKKWRADSTPTAATAVDGQTVDDDVVRTRDRP